jgi:hypothetical protein
MPKQAFPVSTMVLTIKKKLLCRREVGLAVNAIRKVNEKKFLKERRELQSLQKM